jgi:hypothetical protein
MPRNRHTYESHATSVNSFCPAKRASADAANLV